MKDKNKRFSNSIQCRHCGNKAPMEIKETTSLIEEHVDPKNHISWEEGPVYELLSCPACRGITLRSYYWHDAFGDEGIEFEILYPSLSEIPIGLPKLIEREYIAAEKVKNISPNAYGVLLGRLLELVCEDRGAKQSKLSAGLQELSSKGEIPQKLVGIAESLLKLRHVGAHAIVGELTSSEVPILDKSCRAILEYVYSAPYLVNSAEERLKKLREIERKKKRRK